jgi:hypothetical protein
LTPTPTITHPATASSRIPATFPARSTRHWAISTRPYAGWNKISDTGLNGKACHQREAGSRRLVRIDPHHSRAHEIAKTIIPDPTQTATSGILAIGNQPLPFNHRLARSQPLARSALVEPVRPITSIKAQLLRPHGTEPLRPDGQCRPANP